MSTPAYPPERHFIRHVDVTVDARAADAVVGRVRAREELAAPDGSLRAGAIATAFDLSAGRMAVKAVWPDWTATSHLSLHLGRGVSDGEVLLDCVVQRAGRTQVLVEAALRDASGAPVGAGSIGFTRLPRKDGNPDDAAAPPGEVVRFGGGEAGRATVEDYLGVRPLPEPGSGLTFELSPELRNTMGGAQGGVLAAAVEAAALRLAARELPEPARLCDLELHYLAAGRTGPFAVSAGVVRLGAGQLVARVELRDAGQEDRLVALAFTGLVCDG